MSWKPLELLKELVKIPSVNPSFGSDADGAVCGEARLTDFLQRFCEQQQWDWARQRVHPGRDNLIVVVPGDQSRTAEANVVLWDVHQDTVGIEGMQIAPFSAQVSEGRLWGRGACDVKGSMAAMLAALARVRKAPPSGRPTIVLACTVNEENGFTGVKALCRLWTLSTAPDGLSASGDVPPIVAGTLSADDLRACRPQRAIVAEPTLHDVVVAHKGVARWRCHTHGRATHSSKPEYGENAIVAMAEVVRWIDRYQQQELDAHDAHPQCGKPTVCVSLIQGGTGVNTVPDHAVIEIDRRLTPGEQPDRAYQELIDYVNDRAQVGECRVSHDTPWMLSRGLEDDHNGGWAEQVADVVRSLGQTCRLVGVPYGTNASVISQLGIPTVVLGPGSIEQAHTDDEWLAIDELQRATEVFYRLACGDAI